MKTVCSLVAKFARLISCELSCFDRILFKGHLQISRPFELENFVDYVLKMRRADFTESVAPRWSERLVVHAKAFAAQRGRSFEYRHGAVDKDAWAKERRQHARSYADFNPAREADMRFFAAVLAGDG